MHAAVDGQEAAAPLAEQDAPVPDEQDAAPQAEEDSPPPSPTTIEHRNFVNNLQLLIRTPSRKTALKRRTSFASFDRPYGAAFSARTG